MKHLIIVIISIVAFSCSTGTKEDSADVTIDTTTLSLEEAWSTDTTSLATPESVIYDPTNEVYYVSCINGVPPAAKDGDGYIAILNKDGSVKNAEWITGMDAPKGMGIISDQLYVTDIDRILEISISSGEVMNTYIVEGAEFLNDITISGNEVFISDSNTSTIYKLADNNVSIVVQNDAFGGSNGLLFDNNSLLVAGFGSGDFHKVDMQGQNPVLLADSIAGGDGIVKFGENYIVSNWNGEIFSVATDGTTTKLLDTKSAKRNAADIAIGSEADLLVVPEFFANKVTAYRIK